MIFSINAKKVMTFQYLVMIKSSQQTRNKKEIPLPNKGCLQKLTANILMTKRRILSLRDTEGKQRCSLFLILY